MGINKKLAELRERAGKVASKQFGAAAELKVINPDLYDFLHPQSENGKVMKGSTILIYMDEGRIKVCVNDKPVSQTLFVVLGSWKDMWEELTDVIYDPQTEWRAEKRYSRNSD